MTRCPYCQTPIQAYAQECPACRLSFPRTHALVGALPRLSMVVGDTTGQLRNGEINRIRREVGKIQRRYPQVVLQVVMHCFPSEHPFSMHAFWLFNAGAFAGETKRGAENHCLMVLVDPVRSESAIVPGYGLESLVSDDAIGHILDMAGPAFESGKWEAGFHLILEGIDRLLETVSFPEVRDESSSTEF